MNRVALGFMALTSNVPSGREGEYLEWHAMEHMPEMYSVPGIANAQRWRSTARCRRERAAEIDSLVNVENVICYLLAHPGPESFEEFLDLNRGLTERGTHPEPSPLRMEGIFELLDARAAPRVKVSDAVVPWRPNRGIYMLVEKLSGGPDAPETFAKVSQGQIPDLLSIPGVAGLWVFGTSSEIPQTEIPHRGRTTGDFRITISYLDDDPATVGAAFRPFLKERWEKLPAEPCLAGPFESLVQWNWQRLLESA